MVRNSRLFGGSFPAATEAFSLVELIVVVAILAIAAAMVIPELQDTKQFQAMSAARVLATDLEYARDTAITMQTPVTVTFNVQGRSYTLSNASGTLVHPMTKAAYTVAFASQSGSGAVGLVSASFGGAPAVTFDVTGAPNQAGTVRLQAGSFPYTVQVYQATGRVKATYTGS
ncbi:MAG: GspH/FimT family protein [Planctomycetota bacterium]|nr:GspH/FimT family protein [Planctomycetota bacterium]